MGDSEFDVRVAHFGFRRSAASHFSLLTMHRPASQPRQHTLYVVPVNNMYIGVINAIGVYYVVKVLE